MAVGEPILPGFDFGLDTDNVLCAEVTADGLIGLSFKLKVKYKQIK